MEIQITAIKFETVNGKKTGKSFTFKLNNQMNPQPFIPNNSNNQMNPQPFIPNNSNNQMNPQPFNPNNNNNQMNPQPFIPNNNNPMNPQPFIPNNNQIISSTPIKVSQKLLNDFPVASLIGLKNVGATCYMNATLQCLSQIPSLTDYFKYHKYVDETIKKYKKEKKLCLTKSFKNLIENLWPSRHELLDPSNTSKNSNNTYYAPYDFKKKISKMNPLFKGVNANDAKDLVNFIIMTLHEELNKANKNNNNQNNFNIFVDQNNPQVTFQNFLMNFIQENKSIISDIFYGASHTLTICSGCHFSKHNYESFFFLIFPLEEVRKFKIQQLMMNMNQNMMKQQLLNNNIVDMNDCFDYNSKAERFFGENAMYCNTCRRQMTATYQTVLYYTPETLILVLNRGTGIQYKVKLQFSEVLDIRGYSQQSIATGGIYDLIGVVTHMGESGASGHFIAACKSPINRQWYKYNDDLVFPVQDFNSEILNYAMPYILFYQKR